MEAIRRTNPGMETELVTMKTTGDKILDRSLDKIGGKGLFVKELDEALRDGRVDICVHSYKDMPIEDNPELPVVAVSSRENPFDALVLPMGKTGLPEKDILDGMNQQLPLGCSSKRRILQLAELFPGWDCQPIRGNVITRLNKLDTGEFGGLVLAAAGLKRLGMWDRASRVFTPEEMIPSACQGILAIQGRQGEDTSYLHKLHDPDAWDVARAERAFIRQLDGGCTSPVAAYAQLEGEELYLRGMYVNGQNELFKGSIRGHRQEGEALGIQLAEQLQKKGEECGN